VAAPDAATNASSAATSGDSHVDNGRSGGGPAGISHAEPADDAGQQA